MYRFFLNLFQLRTLVTECQQDFRAYTHKVHDVPPVSAQVLLSKYLMMSGACEPNYSYFMESSRAFRVALGRIAAAVNSGSG